MSIKTQSSICKGKKGIFLFFMMLISTGAFSQPEFHCNEVDTTLEILNGKIDRINTDDPELIPLHYFFIEDVEKELSDFVNHTLPLVHQCPDLSYYEIATKYDLISFRSKNVKDTLTYLKSRVDSLFYLKAVDQIMVDNREEAKYYINRSLQYNPLYTESLFLKLQLLFEEERYEECIELIHKLYNEAPLNREQEMAMSDFTAVFYNRLYETGDSLMRNGDASNSLEIFKALESFCQNMPSTYCNDDYYHGIMRSKTGVYNSYITIARVALGRNNREIADKFFEYARLYKEENPDQLIPELELDPAAKLPEKSLTDIDKSVIKNYKTNIEYHQLMVRGMEMYIQHKSEEAYTLFSQAKKLEDCNCFPKDPRLDALLAKLQKL